MATIAGLTCHAGLSFWEQSGDWLVELGLITSDKEGTISGNMNHPNTTNGSSKMHVAGVDGCRGGWLCVDEREGELTGRIYSTFKELLNTLATASIVAVDIPIGLSDAGERLVDPIARKLLRAPRSSSVFPVPIRSVVQETDYRTACQKHWAVDGRALSKQAFAILPKIREVDGLLGACPGLQARVREIHPEVCFAFWNNGGAMKHRKSDPLGRAERERLIDGMWQGQRRRILDGLFGDYESDDVNDALAALWTAKRIISGTAKVLGPQTVDRRGLRMEMWA